MSAIKKCYMCDEPPVGLEHAPARCFFPKGHRINLITVPSCALHNNATSMDDEYVRGIIVTTLGTNGLAVNHWRGDVRKTYLHTPKLFLNTFKDRKGKSFFHDRFRVDNVMIKIAYALYFHIFKRSWQSNPAPFYKQFTLEDGTTDIEYRFPDYKSIPDYEIYQGENQSIFKYLYLEGNFNGRPDCLFKIVFYDGFEVVIMPLKEYKSEPTLVLQPQNTLLF